MKQKLKIPAKRAPMPEGYDGVKTKKQQGSPALQGVGGVHILKPGISLYHLSVRYYSISAGIRCEQKA